MASFSNSPPGGHSLRSDPRPAAPDAEASNVRAMRGVAFVRILVLVLAAGTVAEARPIAGVRHVSQIGAPSVTANVGINVGGVVDYAVESYFVDAMKQARAWGPPSAPWEGGAPVDAHGWPTTDAGLLALCCVSDPVTDTTLLGGTYKLKFTGQADV